MKHLTILHKLFIGVAIILFIGVATISPTRNQTAVAQDECHMGDIVLDTEVFCWAVDAVNFVIQNELFSILTAEDVRDAVKHYRFYMLVVSELNGQ